MKSSYLEVTFRRGRPLAAYLYLPRQPTDKPLCANDSETLASPGITVVGGGERWLSHGESEEGEFPPAAGRGR